MGSKATSPWAANFTATTTIYIPPTGRYLLYMSTSGFHKRCGGILRSLTPPKSEEFHLRFMSFHSCNHTLVKRLSHTMPAGHLQSTIYKLHPPAITNFHGRPAKSSVSSLILPLFAIHPQPPFLQFHTIEKSRGQTTK